MGVLLTKDRSALRSGREFFRFGARGGSAPLPYRPEIDGLRGLSVLAVIAFHLNIGGLVGRGGFLGVDAFFVISGYLIGGIVAKELTEGSFSYRNFLLRRAKRLLPALGTVVAATTIGAWVLFDPGQLTRFAMSLLGVGVYGSNIVFMLDDNYFDQPIATTPLLHTWSLSVEEQFYILFPLVFLLLFRLGFRPLLFGMGALTCSSLAAWLWLRESGWSATAADFSFYLLPTRAWELGVGVLLALAGSAIGKVQGRRRLILAWLGLALFAAALVLGALWPDQGWPSVVVVAGSALLIAFAPANAVGRMLGVSWLVAVGLLSYSLYLWHFPIISFLQIWTGVESLGPGAAGLAISCTGLLAFLTFRFIENPMRFSKLDGRKTVAVILIFVVGVVSLGFASQQPGEAASPEIRTAEALRDHKWVYFGVVDEREFQNERLLLGGLESVDVVVIGSSRLMQVSSAMLGSEALNLSVSGASLEDMFALAPSALVATGARRILLGADPWMIHLDSGQDRWRSLEDEASDWILLAESETRLTDAPRPIPEERNDSSAVLRSLYERINLGADDLVASHGRPELLPKKASDGSHIYDSAYVQQTEREKAAGFDGIIGYANMDSFAMSEKKVEQFKTLITYLRGNGVSVTLVLSPYHPELFRTLKTQHPGFLSAERAYRDIATETGTEILGSYDPVKVGCAMQDFYDGMHPDGSCMAKTIASAEVSNR